MAKITLYGGVDEIGGNKILLQTDNGSVFLDFGRRMGYTQEYFSEFLQIRSKNALRDMIRLGILPKIDGVYSKSLIDVTSIFENEELKNKIPTDKAPDYWTMNDVCACEPDNMAVDGVFVSHAHFDHIQDISFLDPKIPIYSTNITKILAKAITDVSNSHIDSQFYELQKENIITQKSENYKTLCSGACEYSEVKEDGEKPIIFDSKTKFSFTHEITPKYRTFKTEPEGEIKGIKYKMIPVGHSVPGACSVLLTTPEGKRILYTGDIRFTGKNDVSIDNYVKEVGENVDVMITEGTRIESQTVLKESDIEEEINKEIANAEGLVLINFGWKDLSRFKVIYDTAVKNDRIFVISPKLAYLLYEMYFNFNNEFLDPRNLPNLKVYLKREGDSLYSEADYDKFKMGYLHFFGRNLAKKDLNIVRIAERLGIGGEGNNQNNPLPTSSDGEEYDFQEIYDLATHHLKNGVRAYQIREDPSKYILMFAFWDANELFDLIPKDTEDHKTQYISASTEPFNEEMEIDESKLMNWFKKFNVDYKSELKEKKNSDEKVEVFVRRHISGHASQNELIELITKINPTKIIPIHTLHSNLFNEFFGNKVILPKETEPIEI